MACNRRQRQTVYFLTYMLNDLLIEQSFNNLCLQLLVLVSCSCCMHHTFNHSGMFSFKTPPQQHQGTWRILPFWAQKFNEKRAWFLQCKQKVPVFWGQFVQWGKSCITVLVLCSEEDVPAGLIGAVQCRVLVGEMDAVVWRDLTTMRMGGHISPHL